MDIIVVTKFSCLNGDVLINFTTHKQLAHLLEFTDSFMKYERPLLSIENVTVTQRTYGIVVYGYILNDELTTFIKSVPSSSAMNIECIEFNREYPKFKVNYKMFTSGQILTAVDPQTDSFVFVKVGIVDKKSLYTRCI